MAHSSSIARALGLFAAVFVTAVAFARWLPIVTPEGDMALMNLHQLAVLHHWEPVGSYSRHFWHHPGPLYAIVQLPLFWLSGFSHLSTSVTVAFMSAAAIAFTLALLYRSAASISLAIGFALAAAVFLFRVPGLLANPWNPLAPVLSIPLVVTLGSCVIMGRALFLVPLIFLASLAVQAHVGFAAPMFAVLSLATGALLLRAIRAGAGERRRYLRAFGLAVAFGLLLWAPPLSDAISPSGSHNLQMLWTFFRASTGEHGNLGVAAFTRFFVVPFTPALQVPGGEPVGTWLASTTLALTQALLLVAAAIVYQIRGRLFEATWSWVLLAVIALSFASVLRIPEVPLNHTVFWVSVLGVMSWAAIGACLADLFVPGAAPARERSRQAFYAAVGCFIALAATGMYQARLRVATDSSPRVRALAVPLRSELTRERTRSATVRVSPSNWNEVAGVALVLMKQGYDVSVPDDWVWMFGRSMARRHERAPTFLFKSEESDTVPGNFELLAVASTVPIYVQRP